MGESIIETFIIEFAMEMIFNELSFLDLAEDKETAKKRISTLLKVYAAAKEKGVLSMRAVNDFRNTLIAKNYTIEHWILEARPIERIYCLLSCGTLIWKREMKAQKIYSIAIFIV